MNSRMCDMFGIDLPIFAFSHCRDVVVEVSKAGGIGVLSMARTSSDQVEADLNRIDEHIDFLTYPVGQVVGDMREEISVKKVIYELLDEMIDSKERLDAILGKTVPIR